MVPETANVVRGVAGSILIVEVLVDPAPGLPDPGSEWLLLRNVVGGAIRLEGWRLRDSQGETELPVIDLPASASLLVTAHEVGASQGLPAASQRRSLPGRIGNGLNNLGDSLTLVDAVGNVIDAVSWGTDGSVFNPAVTPEQPGTPIRRYGPADTNTAADWRKPADPTTPIVADAGVVALAPPVSLPSTPTPALPPLGSPPASSTPSPNPMAGSTPVPSPVITPPPRRAGIAGAAEDGVILGEATPHAVVLSEIAPRAGWVELYNRGTSPVDLHGWSLADATGAATLLLGDLPSLPMHGFVVVKADGLRLSQPALNLILRRPDGSVADIVSVGRVEPDSSLSRYPAHGGGWVANTPLTAGSYNLPPTEQAEGASAAVTQANSQAAASSVSLAVSRWPLALRVLLALLGGLGVLVLLLLWRRGRGIPPVTPPE